MNPNIEPLKKILLSFKDALENLLELEKGITSISGDDPIPLWQKNQLYSWIFFESQYLFFWGTSEKTKKENQKRDLPKALLEKAEIYYSKWRDKEIKVQGYPTITPRLKETLRYCLHGIPKPEPEETLIRYIERLRNLVSPKTYLKKIWEESLGSFLEFVRFYLPTEHHGFIDVIFPENRTFYSDIIIRLIRKDKFPTNIVVVGEVLRSLAEDVLSGDPRTQHCSAETLAFAWICLTSSRLQLPTGIKLLFNFNASLLKTEEKPERLLFPTRHLLQVPTLFGNIPMEISKQLFEYLSTLSEINQGSTPFFKSSERSLRRAFDRATKKLDLPSEHGELTFTTLTSFPTENFHHRTQIDNSRYRSKITQP